jgi:CopG family nickel-responsive transcriptional regulator
MPAELVDRLDELVTITGYANRSQAIADMVRDRVVQHAVGSDDHEVVATVVLVYDHHQSNLVEMLNVTQHGFQERIVATLHVHLDRANCLEVIVMRGRAKDVRRASNELTSLKGIRHAKTTLTTACLDFDHGSEVAC